MHFNEYRASGNQSDDGKAFEVDPFMKEKHTDAGSEDD
jgi:hypothetical protein